MVFVMWLRAFCANWYRPRERVSEIAAEAEEAQSALGSAHQTATAAQEALTQANAELAVAQERHRRANVEEETAKARLAKLLDAAKALDDVADAEHVTDAIPATALGDVWAVTEAPEEPPAQPVQKSRQQPRPAARQDVPMKREPSASARSPKSATRPAMPSQPTTTQPAPKKAPAVTNP